jgi:hypothetical protein
VQTFAVPGIRSAVPQAARITQEVWYTRDDLWRTVLDTAASGATPGSTYSVMRNGPTVTTQTAGSDDAQVETIEDPGSALPSAAIYGFPAPNVGGGSACDTPVSVVHEAARLLGRRTYVLGLGPNPCPNADTPQDNGPATLWVDAQSKLILKAQMYTVGGHLWESVLVTNFHYGSVGATQPTSG